MQDSVEAELLLRLILSAHGSATLPKDSVAEISPDIWGSEIVVAYEPDNNHFVVYLKETRD